MNKLRRLLLKSGGASGAVAIALATGLLRPSQVFALERKIGAFESKSVADVLKLLGAADAAASQDIIIKAPEMADNGMVVPIEVTSRIPGATSITLLAEKNPFPLVAHTEFSNGASAYLNTRIKLSQSSPVTAVITAGDKKYVASTEVKVTIGGCGG